MENRVDLEKLRRGRWEKTRADLWIIFLHVVAALVLGFSLFPMVWLLATIWRSLGASPLWLKALAFSFSLAFGYFLFGATLIFLSVGAKNLLRLKVTPGLHTMYSQEALDWAGYNAMILIANSAFLDVLRISPFQMLFYRLMGAKIGKNVHVNTAGLADLSLLDIGDNVMIGGGVALIGHAVERGFLKLVPTKIGNNVSIGLGSVVMPGCDIGDGAVIAPCSFLPKGTQVPARGLWGGNPARDLRAERRLSAGRQDLPADRHGLAPELEG